MKRYGLLLPFLISMLVSNAQWKPFRFDFLSVTHTCSSDEVAEEDLGSTVADSNRMTAIALAAVTGDGHFVYGKTMNDALVAYPASLEKQPVAWKMNCGFGYEQVPSVLIEKDGVVFFGTKSGRVNALCPLKQQLVRTARIDNSMVNTVNVPGSKQAIASTMDGKTSLLEIK